MTSETMQRVEKTTSQQSSNEWVENVSASDIRAIQTFDGEWHNVQNCQFKFVGIGNSPAPGAYPSLKYKNEFGQTAYTSLKRILSYSTDPLSSTQLEQQRQRMGQNQTR